MLMTLAPTLTSLGVASVVSSILLLGGFSPVNRPGFFFCLAGRRNEKGRLRGLCYFTLVGDYCAPSTETVISTVTSVCSARVVG